MRPNAGWALGQTRRDRAPAHRHPPDTTWTLTGRRPRPPVSWGRTTLIRGRAIHLIASKPVPATTSTRRGNRARPHVPLARTTTSLGPPRRRTASMHNQDTTSPIPDQPHRAPASWGSSSHRPVSPRASMPIRATMWIRLPPPARRPAPLARTSPTTRRQNAYLQMWGTTSRPLDLPAKPPVMRGRTTHSPDR